MRKRHGKETPVGYQTATGTGAGNDLNASASRSVDASPGEAKKANLESDKGKTDKLGLDSKLDRDPNSSGEPTTSGCSSGGTSSAQSGEAPSTDSGEKKTINGCKPASVPVASQPEKRTEQTIVAQPGTEDSISASDRLKQGSSKQGETPEQVLPIDDRAGEEGRDTTEVQQLVVSDVTLQQDSVRS